jgi:hypothetical protein
LVPLLAFFNASCNKATGLPIQLDLTDQDVTIPAGFTREFVEEIEARLAKDSELDKYELKITSVPFPSTLKNKNKIFRVFKQRHK